MHQLNQLKVCDKSSLESYWEAYCSLNLDDSQLRLLGPRHRSLKTKVLNSIDEFTAHYHLLNSPLQNTLKGKHLVKLSLTKKAIDHFTNHLVKQNPNQRMILFFYPEMHQCWKPCHWEVNGEGLSFLYSGEWKHHNRNLCQCFPQRKNKHWKCLRKAHVHAWHDEKINLSQLEQATNLSSFVEDIEPGQVIRKLFYNMKDWKNFYLYPSSYSDFGWSFNRKWYMKIDTTKFLADRQKRAVSNRLYRARIKEQLLLSAPGEISAVAKRRHNLIKQKSKLIKSLQKLAWNDSQKRAKINAKIVQIKSQLISKKY